MGTRSNAFFYMFLTSLCGVAYLLVFVQRFVPGILGIEMDREIGFGITNLAIFTSVNLYAYGLFQFPAGFLTDKFGARPIITVSLLVAGVGAILFGLSSSMTSLVISRVIIGIGCAPILVAGLSLLALRLPSERFPFYTTVLYVFGGLGPFVGALPLAALSSHWGWRAACWSIGVFSIIYAVVIFILFKYLEKSPVATPLVRNEKVSESVGIKGLFCNKTYLLFLGIGAGAPAIYLVYGGLWASKYLFDVYGYTIDMYTHVLSWGAIGGLAGFLLSPFIALKLVRSVKVSLGIFAFTLAGVLAVFMHPYNVPFWWLKGAMFGIGFLSCGSQVVAVIGIKNIFSSGGVGKALGLYNMFPLLFGGILQTVVGFLVGGLIGSLGPQGAYFYGFMPPFFMCIVGGICAILSIMWNKK